LYQNVQVAYQIDTKLDTRHTFRIKLHILCA